MNISDIVLLLGGVALFLFGMGLMGDSLKKVAGNKLEPVLYKLSATPLKGILLGTGVTAIIQSSSATSVMVVGFVNSEMMKLKQAISVIMGAIIGTSITGWIICLSELGSSSVDLSLLSTESISAVVAIVGMLLRMTSKKKSVQNVGNILMGFSVLMFGMKTMSASVSGLRESPFFISMITTFTNPIFGIIIGALFTAVIQSSSAAVGILQALSTTGAITFSIAMPMILGIAIGASVPVLIAGTGASAEGKRTSVSYLVIEIIRTVLFFVVFSVLDAIIGFDFTGNTMNMLSIALLNSIFRISTVIVLAPFTGRLEKLMKFLVRGNKKSNAGENEINNLDTRLLAYPASALEASSAALTSMVGLTKKNLADAIMILETYSDKLLDEIEADEAAIDKYQDKIGNYLAQLAAHELSDAESRILSRNLNAITDLERISDHALNIAHSASAVSDIKEELPDVAVKEVQNLCSAITEIVDITFQSLTERDLSKAYIVEPFEQVIDLLCKNMRANHIARLQKNESSLQNGYVLNDLITNFERISDHCSNIAIEVVEEKENINGAHELGARIKSRHTNGYDTYFERYSSKYLM